VLDAEEVLKPLVLPHRINLFARAQSG